MYGYAGKLLFVNLSTGEIKNRELSEELARNYLGGPALGARILYDEMPAKTDVFGEESMLGIVGGPVNGTQALFGGRYTVVSKSPVTGGWNDANSGGFFAPVLKASGFDAVFVNGISEKPVYIYLNNGEVEIRDASHLWGMTTTQTEKALRKEIGDDKINAALIGPGGERLSYIAAVMNDSHRAAGRGGSGAVMGSKKLKAIVVRGDQKIDIYDHDALIQCNREIGAHMKGPAAQTVAQFGTYGTGGGYIASVLSGDASVKNWGGSGVADYPEDDARFASPYYLDKYKTKKYSCANCPLGCGAMYDMIGDERFGDMINVQRPEYETLGAFGSQMCNKDGESIVKTNDLCNEYGLDTISVGATIAWAMECYNEGVLSREELDGIDLTWGNGDAIVAMTEKICAAEGCGKILLNGSKYAADYYGRGHEFLVTANGIEEPQHDSRFSFGLARTYRFDPTPGRHVKASPDVGRGGLDTELYPNYFGTGLGDTLNVISTEITNSSGLCLFDGMCMPQGMPVRLINAITGFNYSQGEAYRLGLRMFNMRHAFNVREGFRREDYKLDRRMYAAQPPTTGPLADIVVDHEKLADNFFNAIGWNYDAVPFKSTLEFLGGFENVIADLYPDK